METLVIRVSNADVAARLLKSLEADPMVIEANWVQSTRFNELIEQMEDEIDMAAAQAFDPEKEQTFSVQDVEAEWQAKRAA